MYSKVKVAGHPIHPMLIAFPVAFYVGTFVSFLIYQSGGDPFWYRAGYVANVAGVIMALVAAVPGFIDWYAGIPRNTAPKRDGAIHAALNVAALLLFAINLWVTASAWPEWESQPPESAAAPLVIALLGVLCTAAAGWFGWRLVQTHHVGVDLTRSQQRLEEVDVRDSEEYRGRDRLSR